MKCPLCGSNDATLQKYDGKRKELTVRHEDGTECTLQPCDIKGNLD